MLLPRSFYAVTVTKYRESRNNLSLSVSGPICVPSSRWKRSLSGVSTLYCREQEIDVNLSIVDFFFLYILAQWSGIPLT